MTAKSLLTLVITTLTTSGIVSWFYLSQKDKEQEWNKKIQSARLELEESQLQEKELIGKIDKNPAQIPSTTLEIKTELRSNPLKNSSSPDPFLSGVYDLVDKSAEIYEHFQKNPGSTIPELSLLTEANWIELGENADLSTPHGIQVELAKTRNKAKGEMMESLLRSIWSYLDDHPGTTPKSFSELKPYIKAPISDAMLARYEIFTTEEPNPNPTNSNKKPPTKITIRELIPVNAEFEKPSGLVIKGRTGSMQGGLKNKALLPPQN